MSYKQIVLNKITATISVVLISATHSTMQGEPEGRFIIIQTLSGRVVERREIPQDSSSKDVRYYVIRAMVGLISKGEWTQFISGYTPINLCDLTSVPPASVDCITMGDIDKPQSGSIILNCINNPEITYDNFLREVDVDFIPDIMRWYTDLVNQLNHCMVNRYPDHVLDTYLRGETVNVPDDYQFIPQDTDWIDWLQILEWYVTEAVKIGGWINGDDVLQKLVAAKNKYDNLRREYGIIDNAPDRRLQYFIDIFTYSATFGQIGNGISDLLRQVLWNLSALKSSTRAD